MTKKIFLFVAVLFSTRFCLQAQKTVDTLQKHKQLYESAYNEMTQMLEGKKSISFKKAVFLMENAYLNNTWTYERFNEKISSIAIVTDTTVQTQIRADATAGLTQNNKNYNSYHTSVTTLNTTINMVSKAETTTKAEGFSAGVTHKDEVINGSTGLARLSREAAGNFMITPEGTPSITAPSFGCW